MRINTAIYLFPLFLRYGQETPQENLDTVFKFEKLWNARKKKILKREFTIGFSVVNSEEQLICPHPRVNHLMASWMILLKNK